jgi:flavodoxin
MSDILVAYYSHSGNTEKIARVIGEQGGILLRIEPVEAYPENYNSVVDQAKREIGKGFLPALKTEIPDLSAYSAIFVGTPNWWSTIAPPIATFLSSGMAGKKIVPFCTHGGGGTGRILGDIKKLCPNAEVLNCFEIYGDGSGAARAKLVSWLKTLNIKGVIK